LSYLLKRRRRASRCADWAFNFKPNSHFTKIKLPTVDEEAYEEELILEENVLTDVDITVSVNFLEAITITETLVEEVIYHVSDTLVFNENFTWTEELSETLSLIEKVEVDCPVRESLTLVERVSTDQPRTVTETLTFNEFVWIGSLGGCTEIYIPDPLIGINTNTTLSYPYTSPTHTVTLRNPEFGNKQIQDSSSVSRLTRGGEQVTFRDVTWPIFQYLELEFKALTKAQRDDFMELVEAAAGDEIKLVDWENRIWRGHIASEPNEIIQTKDDDCSYEIRFKFEGELI